MAGKDTKIDHHRLGKVLERWSFLITYFVGIDIAKYSHVACVLDQFNEVHTQPFEFSNDLSGFKLLISSLSSFPKEDTIIGFESTAHYHENLFYFLNRNYNYNCELINSIVSSWFRSLSIRDIKTDKVDALSIASFLSFNSSKVGNDNFIIKQLNYLCDDRHELMKSKTKLYIQLTAALDCVFPELKPFFKKNLKTNIAHNLLKNYSTAFKTRMSKRGNKFLRYALIWSVNNVRKNSKTMEEYYYKKRSQGKSHYNALGHCATKLVNYIFFILNNPNKVFTLE